MVPSSISVFVIRQKHEKNVFLSPYFQFYFENVLKNTKPPQHLKVETIIHFFTRTDIKDEVSAPGRAYFMGGATSKWWVSHVKSRKCTIL